MQVSKCNAMKVSVSHSPPPCSAELSNSLLGSGDRDVPGAATSMLLRPALFPEDSTALGALPSPEHLEPLGSFRVRSFVWRQAGPREHVKARLLHIVDTMRNGSELVEHTDPHGFAELRSLPLARKSLPPVGIRDTRVMLMPMLTAPFDKELVGVAIDILEEPAFSTVGARPSELSRMVVSLHQRRPLSPGSALPARFLRAALLVMKSSSNRRPVSRSMLRNKWAQLTFKAEATLHSILGLGPPPGWRGLVVRDNVALGQTPIKVLFRIATDG